MNTREQEAAYDAYMRALITKLARDVRREDAAVAVARLRLETMYQGLAAAVAARAS